MALCPEKKNMMEDSAVQQAAHLLSWTGHHAPKHSEILLQGCSAIFTPNWSHSQVPARAVLAKYLSGKIQLLHNCYWVCFFGECVVVWILFCVQGCIQEPRHRDHWTEFSSMHSGSSKYKLERSFTGVQGLRHLLSHQGDEQKNFWEHCMCFSCWPRAIKLIHSVCILQSSGDLHLHVMRHCQA